jgi:hypothetical protein
MPHFVSPIYFQFDLLVKYFSVFMPLSFVVVVVVVVKGLRQYFTANVIEIVLILVNDLFFIISC